MAKSVDCGILPEKHIVSLPISSYQLCKTVEIEAVAKTLPVEFTKGFCVIVSLEKIFKMAVRTGSRI